MRYLRTILIQILLFIWLQGISQPPAGYYDAANGLSGAALKTALFNIVEGHTSKSYDYLWTAFQTTDKKSNGKVWCMYSDVPGGTPAYQYTFVSQQCGSYNSEADCYNREHSFPSSWFNDASPMNTDLFHIYPTDGYVNSQRSNYPLGKVNSPSWTSTNGSKRGSNSTLGYGGIVFEPIDEYKGDFARTYFYMATRYENVISSWRTNSTAADAVLDGTSYPVFEPWVITLLLQWHTDDPVSQKETDRNNAVYAIQGNRNPFIDNPTYAASIWGGQGGLKAAPSAHAGTFTAHNIKLSWTEPVSGVLPDGYLIRWSTTGYANIPTPQDGSPVADGSQALNVSFGDAEVLISNLLPSTTYYFKIFPYTGSGAEIIYKTDGTVPQVQKSTYGN